MFCFAPNNNTTYVSPLDFYLKNGFTVCKEIRIESEKISAVKIVWNELFY